MSTVGIIAEFNPLHNGHAYLIEQAKKITGADTCVVVMSGNFVQRGTPAVCDKYLRTRMALETGADAVFELPTAFATASAELFAEAGVKLLNMLGCVDYLAFGSECGDIDKITKVAAIVADEPEEYKQILAQKLKEGLSFPAAREIAFTAVSGDPTLVDLLKSPNNILGIEYCKALINLKKELGPDAWLPIPVTINRVGSKYNDEVVTDETYPSATSIRNYLTGQDGKMNIHEFVNHFSPKAAAQILEEGVGKCLPVEPNDLSDMLFVRLASLSRDAMGKVMDLSPDLINKLISCQVVPTTFTGMVETLKSKNYTYSMLSRALLHIVLGVRADLVGALKHNTTLPYVRLLGFRQDSSALMRTISDHLGPTLITKLANADRTDILLQTDIFAAECYNQILKTKFHLNSPSEFAAGVVRV